MKNEIRGGDVYVYVPNKNIAVVYGSIACVHVTQRVIVNINKRCIIVSDTLGMSQGYAIWYKLGLN